MSDHTDRQKGGTNPPPPSTGQRRGAVDFCGYGSPSLSVRPQPPTAEVLHVRGSAVIIRCPYCNRQHIHTVMGKAVVGRRERFAPSCGLMLNPDDRARGYQFTIADEGVQP